MEAVVEGVVVCGRMCRVVVTLGGGAPAVRGRSSVGMPSYANQRVRGSLLEEAMRTPDTLAPGGDFDRR